MKRCSISVFANNDCIYKNKSFWTRDFENILNDYNTKEIKDIFGNKVNLEDFKYDYAKISKEALHLENNISSQIQYNIDVGKEFISLFREEFVRTPLKEMTSLDIAQKTANLIPLILTGSFREACDLLRLYEPDEFMTRERIDKYIAMLTSADAIDYNYEETNTEESTTVSENEEENVVENFTEELEEN